MKAKPELRELENSKIWFFLLIILCVSAPLWPNRLFLFFLFNAGDCRARDFEDRLVRASD